MEKDDLGVSLAYSAVERMLASISHDINRPFSNLSMFLSILQMEEAAPSRSDTIEKNSQALLTEIEGVRGWLKAMRSFFMPLESSRAYIEVDRSLQGAIARIKKGYPEVEIACLYKGNHAVLLSNEDALAQVFYHLITFGIGHQLQEIQIVETCDPLPGYRWDIQMTFAQPVVLRADYVIPFFMRQDRGSKDMTLPLANRFLASLGGSLEVAVGEGCTGQFNLQVKQSNPCKMGEAIIFQGNLLALLE